MWTCEECQRSFGRTNQGHMCAPGLTEAEFFATSDARERPIYDAVRAHLDDFDDVFTEFVAVGVFFKNGPVFAELRPRKKWVAVTFKLPARLSSDRLSRKVIPTGGNGSLWYHVVNVADAGGVDEQLCDWLTEAYFAT